MVIIPAIDIIDGHCVRLQQGDYTKKTVYSADPVQVAQDFAAAGAEMLHIVDLDGAKAGHPQNLAVIKDIVDAVDIPIELGGGIRDLACVQQVLGIGVARVILGSVVLEEPQWLPDAIKQYQECIVVGIDAREGNVAVHGWLTTTNKPALDLALEMKNLGVQEIIYTDIAKDGMLEGPNIEALAEMTKSGLKIVASGGVTSLEDIRHLRALEDQGVYAAIVGKALYTNDLDLEQAIKVASSRI